MSLYRPEFVAALTLFAKVSEAMVRAGHPRPVLVGGAAVELYSASAIATGDFNVVTVRQDVFEAELVRHGFVRPAGPGTMTRGYVHPDLGLGFEVVGDMLLDGHADHTRIRLIVLSADRERFAVIAVEDLIADRMGQYASGTAPEMLEQAHALLKLSSSLDLDYLDRRIREETAGDHGLADLHD